MTLLFNRIKTYDQNQLETLSSLYQTCFKGEPVDERGLYSTKLLNQEFLVSIKYIHENYKISYNANLMDISEFNNMICSITQQNILIDSTTLSFPEVLFLLDALNNNEHIVNIDILYVEPKQYKQKSENEHNSNNKFTLSEKFENFSPIPTFVSLNDVKIDFVVFLGFEKSRIGKLFEFDEGSHYDCFYPVIPLPAYALGWESHTVKMHLDYLNSNTGFETKNLKMVGANNPFQAYNILAEIATITNNKFRIIPIGTKPCTIGCAIFLVNQRELDNDDTSIDAVYDFPKISNDRSEGIGRINLYTLSKK